MEKLNNLSVSAASSIETMMNSFLGFFTCNDPGDPETEAKAKTYAVSQVREMSKRLSDIADVLETGTEEESDFLLNKANLTPVMVEMWTMTGNLARQSSDGNNEE